MCQPNLLRSITSIVTLYTFIWIYTYTHTDRNGTFSFYITIEIHIKSHIIYMTLKFSSFIIEVLFRLVLGISWYSLVLYLLSYRVLSSQKDNYVSWVFHARTHTHQKKMTEKETKHGSGRKVVTRQFHSQKCAMQ